MSRQAGFGLIEVLVAVLVLAIGLLGLAGLQANAVKTNHSALLRSQAVMLAYDITDRMRANRKGYEGGFYNNPAPKNHQCVWDGTSVAICTPQQMAEHDVWEWNAAVAQALPQGVGVVCLDATPNDGDGDTDGDGLVDDPACDNSGSFYVVKLWWVDEFDRTSGAPVINRFVTVFQP